MKKIMTLSVIALLSLGIFAGCGAESAATTPQANDETLEQVTLSALIGQPRFREQYETYFAKFIERVREEQGIDLTINLEMPSDGEISMILQTRMASNNSPDIFNFHPTNDGPTYARAGWLLDLSDQPFVDRLVSFARDAVTIDGQIIGVPLETTQWGFLYNRDIFNELNLELPNTLTEMREVIAVLEANDITPFVLSYAEGWIPQLFISLTTGSLIETQNPNFIADMNAGTTSYAEFEQMFEIMDLVNAHGTARPFEVGADQGAADFASGAAAMYVQGPWMADSILSVNSNMNFGVAPLPVDDNPAGTLVNLGFSNGLAVSTFSQNQEIAIQLMNFMLDAELSSDFYQSMGFNPVADVHQFDTHPWQSGTVVLVEAGRAYLDPLIPGPVKSESERAFQSYFAGTMTREEVIDALDNAWAQYVSHQ